jgi:Acetyl/propionyl-CoA carboxylase, alpha subunit
VKEIAPYNASSKVNGRSALSIHDPKLRKAMGDAAVKAAEYIKYEGAGTVEFLVDKHRNFYFMEMNTRIQVEHPITEQVIDFDLIREQILVAAGVKISGKNYEPTLHSIECRINAEDPYHDFRPSPGKITVLHRTRRTRRSSRYSMSMQAIRSRLTMTA